MSSVLWSYLLLVAVVLRVSLSRLRRVMQRMLMMPISRMGVMGRSFVIAAVMKFGGLFVMSASVFVMLCSLAMMFSSLFGHVHSL